MEVDNKTKWLRGDHRLKLITSHKAKRIGLIMIMGFVFSLFGCPKSNHEQDKPVRFVTEQAYKQNLANQKAMSPKTMAHLRTYGVTTDSMLRLEFFFYTNTQQKATALTAPLGELGYKVEAKPSADDETVFVITGWTNPIKMDDAIVIEWENQMCKLGYEHDCEFDGWGTNPSQ